MVGLFFSLFMSAVRGTGEPWSKNRSISNSMLNPSHFLLRVFVVRFNRLLIGSVLSQFCPHACGYPVFPYYIQDILSSLFDHACA